MVRTLFYCSALVALDSLNPVAAADPTLEQKIADGKKELAKLERDLAKLSADTPAVVGQWVWAGEMKMRVTGAELRDAMVMTIEGPAKTGEKELAVKVEVATTSRTRRVHYSAFGSGLGITDDRGNRYGSSGGLRHFGGGGLSNGSSQVSSKTLEPGDRSFTDVLFFQPPKAGAKELRIALTGLQYGSTQGYHFRLSSWSPERYPPAGTAAAIEVLEKASLLSEDKGDREKLKDAAEVLKRVTAGPPIATADREREKGAEELAEKIAAKRDEILAREAELTAGEFVPPGEWVQVGDLRVRVVGAEVTKPIPLNDKGEKQTPSYAYLVVRVEVENRAKKKVQYRRWETDPFVPTGQQPPPSAALMDLHGNRHTSRDSVSGTFVGFGGAVPNKGKEVDAGTSFEDVVCFEPPLKSSGELRLTLGAAQSGEKGSYRFKIPAADWKPQK